MASSSILLMNFTTGVSSPLASTPPAASLMSSSTEPSSRFSSPSSSSFWLKESEEIRFDLVSGALGPQARRVVSALVALAAAVLFGMSLPATIDYVTFMKVESTAYMGIRLDILYAVYPIFVIAVVVRYLWVLWCRLRAAEPEKPKESEEVSSGL